MIDCPLKGDCFHGSSQQEPHLTVLRSDHTEQPQLIESVLSGIVDSGAKLALNL